ncbi:MAG: cell division protein ZapA [Bacteroidales bacterium]|nr:cell division protein ZapA [Bacteroidales bacterium]
MSDKVNIQLIIAGISFSLLIKKEDEPIYRYISKVLNNLYVSFSQKFPGKEVHEYLGMAIIQFAYDILSEKKEQTENSKEINLLKKLDEKLELFLAEQDVL